ncbi:hypothetical protein P879_09576 [Paragonimus westermani]|uniref:Uncharacterized protein n=1 Tax=Paragonimus westermani TaxID=34504 RepID=A0A8T0DJD3_9TREM|nr:hypothetical protein P879_09576 [Paragonimus westermani]
MVLVGQHRPFMCDLVPLDAADRLDGKWTANVYGQLTDLVVVDVSNGRARVMPRDPPGFYQSVGQLQVHCVFTTPNGTMLYDFNRTVTIVDEAPLMFSPPDGLLRVGSSQHIYCLPQGVASSDREEVERICRVRRIPCNSIRLIDVGGHTDLLSTDHSSVPVKIRPPSGKSSYTRYGSTTVSCSYVVKSGGKVERNLTVRILPEHPNGTLNGNDTGNQTVFVGQHRPFMCDLVPLDAADRLDGKWTANVYGQLTDLVVVDVSNGRARVMPRDPPGFYQSDGQLQVHCVFTTPNGTMLYDFNRTVTIVGGCLSVRCNFCARTRASRTIDGTVLCIVTLDLDTFAFSPYSVPTSSRRLGSDWFDLVRFVFVDYAVSVPVVVALVVSAAFCVWTRLPHAHGHACSHSAAPINSNRCSRWAAFESE